MLQTNYGLFDGKSWEHLCQLIFKLKHGADGYQHIQADPGDFGLEGVTIHTGQAFQCYCPEKHYGTAELYAAQRSKITSDIAKLKKHESEISKRIGSIKLRDWLFVSPVIEKNALLAHAKKKEKEVRGWNLAILAADFTIQLRDGHSSANRRRHTSLRQGHSCRRQSLRWWPLSDRRRQAATVDSQPWRKQQHRRS